MFEKLLREATLIMAQIHASLMRLNDGFAFGLDDKQLHFVIMAALGMFLFFMVHFVFSRVARWSITVISFIYVFTVMTVLCFAIEIGQRITGTGNMDFGDVVAGLQGVVTFFAVYTAYRLILLLIQRVIRKMKDKK